MASNYYDQTKVKADLRITDTANDTQLDHWSDEAEADIDARLYDVAAKARLVASLPVLPYASGSIPEAVQGAADHYVKARYYEFTKNPEMTNIHEKKWKEKVDGFIKKLTVDREIYGRAIRS